MTNPNQLYDDMERLNALYEELCWAHDDELVFTHENGRVIIYNKTQEKKKGRGSEGGGMHQFVHGVKLRIESTTNISQIELCRKSVAREQT